MTTEKKDTGFRRRDGNSLVLLGGFFMVIAVLVLCGIFWSHEEMSVIVVNLVAGAALLAIGGGTFYTGMRLIKSAPPEDSPRNSTSSVETTRT